MMLGLGVVTKVELGNSGFVFDRTDRLHALSFRTSPGHPVDKVRILWETSLVLIGGNHGQRDIASLFIDIFWLWRNRELCCRDPE